MKTKEVTVRVRPLLGLLVWALVLLGACHMLSTPDKVTKPTCEAVKVIAEACKMIQVQLPDGTVVDVPLEDIHAAAAARRPK